jgi:hypothetical protein
LCLIRNLNVIQKDLSKSPRRRRKRASISIQCEKREREILEEKYMPIKKEEVSFKDPMLHL